MKTYRLYHSKVLVTFCAAVLAAIALTGVAGIIAGLFGKIGPSGPPTWVFALVLAFALFYGYMWFGFPYQITVRDDGSIEFRSIFRTVTTSLLEIKSVQAKRYTFGFVDVVCQARTIHLLNQIDGFHEFLATLKSANPVVVIKGC